MTMGHLLMIVAIVVGLVLFALWDARRSRGSGASRPTSEMMAELASGAAEVAEDVYGIRLDFSVESIDRVETLLARLHDEHRARAFLPGRLAAEANRWGAYVGEVVRRIRGGAWQRDSVNAGRNTLPLVLSEREEIYPCAWCFRRISNGEEDNISVKFRLAVTTPPGSGGVRGPLAHTG
jgi:hypothetical protein